MLLNAFHSLLEDEGVEEFSDRKYPVTPQLSDAESVKVKVETADEGLLILIDPVGTELSSLAEET